MNREIKVVEESLRKSELQFRSVWENSFDGMRLIDKQGVIIIVNDAFCGMVEKNKEDLEGKMFSVMYDPLNESDLIKKQIQRFADQTIDPHFERKMTLWNGKQKWFELSNSYINIENSEPLLLSIFRDITRRKLAEEELKFREERYRIISEQTGQLIYDWNIKTGHIQWTGAIEPITGFSIEEYQRVDIKSWKEYVHPEERENVVRLLDIATKTGARYDVEYRLLKKDGSYVFVEDSGIFLKDSFGLSYRMLGTIKDISERKRSEEFLILNEERLNVLYKISTLPLKSEKEIFNFALEECVRITGSKIGYLHFLQEDQINLELFIWSREVYKACKAKETPKYPLGDAGVWADCIKTGKPVIHNDYENLTNKKKLPEGHIPIKRHLSIPIFDEEKIVAIAGVGNKQNIYTDADVRQLTLFISEAWKLIKRKQAERSLAEREELYRKLIATLPDVILTTDLEGNFTFMNDIAKKLGDIQDYKNENIFNFIAPEDRERALNNSKLMFEKSLGPVEYKLLGKNGETFLFEVNGEVLRDPEEVPFGMVFSGRDITARKQTEQALRKSEQLYRKLTESYLDMIFIATLEGELIYVNTAGASVYNSTPEQMIGKTQNELFPKHIVEKHLIALRGLIETSEVFNFEEKIAFPTGEIWLDIRLVPLSDENGNINSVLGLCRNITQSKKSEHERLRLQNLETLGILAGGIAHDFNNLLGAILGRVDLAMYNLPDGAIKNNLLSIEKATQRAVGLTRQLLAFAKGGTPEKCSISIRKIVQDTAKFALSGSNVESKFTFKDTLNVEADPGQIAQVIQNLVINAKQAMPFGGAIEISTSDYIDEINEKYTKIIVKDSGIGIPKDYLDRIFDPYFTTKESGSGLGLSVCYSIIQKHEGAIYVESTPGAGTTFTILLPTVKTVEFALESKNNVVTQRLKCLIMDDDDEIREVFSAMLHSLGHNVTITREGSEAVTKFVEALDSDKPYDLVFLDLTVKGGMGGKEAIEIIKQKSPNVKAIVCSGYAESAIANYKQDGFDEKLSKPYTIGQLNEVIYHLLNNK
jgi:two-component system, cell cycle sensor histidine kinase and response regulator CckA